MAAPAMGMFRAISDSGYVVGPLALGIIADMTSSITALQVTAATLLLAGVLFALRAPESLHREGSRVTAPSAPSLPESPPPAP